MTTKEVLIKTRELIADPDNWTVGSLAVDGRGAPTHPRADEAVRWCALGALYKVTKSAALVFDASTQLWLAADNSPSDVNDQEGHAAVIKMYDRAIQSL